MRWQREDGEPLHLKVRKGDLPLQAWARPMPKQKVAKLLLPSWRKFDSTIWPDHVAVCKGLAKPVKGCWWEIVAIHPRASHAAKRVAIQIGTDVALFLLDDPTVEVVEI